jgi:hypothetical protein
MNDARQTRMKSQAEAQAAVDVKRAARRAAAALKERFGDDFDVGAAAGALTFGPSALYRLVEAVRHMTPAEAREFQAHLRCVRGES